MTARYAIRYETADGTLEDAWHHMSRKAEAIACARRAAKGTVCEDVVKVWVDDTTTDLGIVSFKTRFADDVRIAAIPC